MVYGRLYGWIDAFCIIVLKPYFQSICKQECAHEKGRAISKNEEINK